MWDRPIHNYLSCCQSTTSGFEISRDQDPNTTHPWNYCPVKTYIIMLLNNLACDTRRRQTFIMWYPDFVLLLYCVPDFHCYLSSFIARMQRWQWWDGIGRALPCPAQNQIRTATYYLWNTILVCRISKCRSQRVPDYLKISAIALSREHAVPINPQYTTTRYDPLGELTGLTNWIGCMGKAGILRDADGNKRKMRR